MEPVAFRERFFGWSDEELEVKGMKKMAHDKEKMRAALRPVKGEVKDARATSKSRARGKRSTASRALSFSPSPHIAARWIFHDGQATALQLFLTCHGGLRRAFVPPCVAHPTPSPPCAAPLCWLRAVRLCG